jgi:hypothetical protein
MRKLGADKSRPGTANIFLSFLIASYEAVKPSENNDKDSLQNLNFLSNKEKEISNMPIVLISNLSPPPPPSKPYLRFPYTSVQYLGPYMLVCQIFLVRLSL